MSAALAHPLPTSIEAVAAANVGPGRVGIGPVGVYAGRSETGPPLLIVGGGHASADVTEEGMLPAPVPPVCQAAKGGVHGLEFPQTPTASRGSVGIQPFSRPSWYDHAGVSTLPLTLELPIFHVQKK